MTDEKFRPLYGRFGSTKEELDHKERLERSKRLFFDPARRDLGLPPDEPMKWEPARGIPKLPGVTIIRLFGPSFENLHIHNYNSSLCAYWVTGDPDKFCDVTELTSTNGRINELVAERWEFLFFQPADLLSNLFMQVFHGGVTSHRVLTDGRELEAYGWRTDRSDGTQKESDYVISKDEYGRVRKQIGRTTKSWIDESIVLRIVTISGWMHRKDELGIERITLRSDGSIEFAEREILSERIFEKMPDLLY
ncbi:MAG: hypothetical protein AAF456_03265 [Planctomycetota bacterium]